MLITLEARHFNALMANVAKGNVRYYFNGFMVDLQHHLLVGTDGHTLITIPFESSSPPENRQIILKTIAPKAPKGGRVFIDLKAMTIGFTTVKGIDKGTHLLEEVDAKYPDYRSVLPETDPKLRPTKVPAFNPHLISRTVDALAEKGPLICRLAFAVKDGRGRPVKDHTLEAFQVLIVEEPDVTLTVMPARA